MNDVIVKQITILSLLFSVPNITCAQNVSVLTQTTSAARVIGVTVLVGGSSFNVDKQGLIVFPAESFRTDSFQADRNKISFASAIGISFNKILENNKYKAWSRLHRISLGLNFYFNQNSRTGSVYEYNLLDFNNSTYTMNLDSYRVMLDTEWVIQPLYWGMMPFVQAGIGSAQNNMNFKNIPRPDIGADGGNYNLSHHAGVQFAYEFGAGLKIPVNEYLMVSARYLFADAGNASSGISDNVTGVVLARPVRTKVQSQSVFFGLSYFFG